MSFSSVQLNADQQYAADYIRDFLKDPTTVGEVFTLTGGPGTGKTFMLKTVLERYKGLVQGATVSHAAKNILQESLGDRVVCITISRLLGLSKDIDDEGTIKFQTVDRDDKTSKIGKAKLLILDEVSQIEDELYNRIIYEAKQHGVRIIAVGDPYQLPPVEQDHDSKFFTKIHSRLTIPMRFQGPIAEIAAVYRTQIDNLNLESDFDKWALNTHTHRVNKIENGTGYIFTNNLNEIIQSAAHDIMTHPTDTSYARVLAFRNEAVTTINGMIREVIYGTDLKQFEPSELVISRGGYAVFDRNIGKRIPILYNGQILRIKSYIPVEGPEGVPCVLVNFENFANAGGYPVFVVSNTFEGTQAYNRALSDLLKLAKNIDDPALARPAWRRYYAFMESFAYFDYAYSVNLYKAQGQTLNNVYVCEGEVMDVKPLTWKQKFQALYVAMTRAKEKLFIYNKEF